MKPERLQEIKNKWKRPKEMYPLSSFEAALWSSLEELIVAVEETQAELVEATKHSVKVGETWREKWSEDIADLRKQLAEAQAFSDKLGASSDKLLQKNNDLRVELDRAHSVTKRNKASKEFDVLRQELDECRAEVEEWKSAHLEY